MRALALVVTIALGCHADDRADDLPPDGREPPGDGLPDDGGVALFPLDAHAWGNSVRDLFGLPDRPDVTLPSDPVVGAFDHVAEGMSTSAWHVELYDGATRAVTAPLADPAHPAWARLADCDPTGAVCRAAVLTAFAARAWRRPPEADELDGILRWVEDEVGAGRAPQAALADGFGLVLLSPRFLYRVEDRARADGATVDAWELAARLASFLWKSLPDEPLRAAAEDGSLLEPDVLEAHVQRMFDDPRSASLVEDLGGQWLDVRKVADLRPEHDAYSPLAPDHRARLLAAMQAEMYARFDEVLRRDGPVGDLFRGDSAFVGPELAELYGLGTAGTPGWVALPPERRGGMLTSAGWLVATSNFLRTSPTRRGVWITERLLCAPPTSPPGDLSVGDAVLSSGEGLTMREFMERATADPYCQTCHARIDPYGFPLEGFDWGGAFDLDREGKTLNLATTLPTGESVDGAVELAAALADQPRLAWCFLRHLLTYALARVPDDAEVDALQAVLPDGVPMRTAVLAVTRSEAFRARLPPAEETP